MRASSCAFSKEEREENWRVKEKDSLEFVCPFYSLSIDICVEVDMKGK